MSWISKRRQSISDRRDLVIEHALDLDEAVARDDENAADQAHALATDAYLSLPIYARFGFPKGEATWFDTKRKR